MLRSRTFYGYDVTTAYDDGRRKTITTITHGTDKILTIATRGNRFRSQHSRLVRFAEYAETKPVDCLSGFGADPAIVHNVAVGRGSF